MSKTGLKMDWSEFDKKFYPLVEKAMPGEARNGIFAAVNEMLKDAAEVPPKAPKDHGDLWGSREASVIVKFKRLIGIAAFNIFYATKWHELPKGREKNISYTTPGSGRKFLESKMFMFREKYMRIVADFLKKTRV